MFSNLLGEKDWNSISNLRVAWNIPIPDTNTWISSSPSPTRRSWPFELVPVRKCLKARPLPNGWSTWLSVVNVIFRQGGCGEIWPFFSPNHRENALRKLLRLELLWDLSVVCNHVGELLTDVRRMV